ncbi:MAG: DegT/DnrJ/EryC1/StrS family aminotransferase [Vicinamibacterales bacterium]|nr:DegT/DnrJ/EryC1/StrS family aminotransferase [Vicinamibacterales bacterium]
MIPRLRPAFGLGELTAAIRPGSPADVEAFERDFAARFEAAEGVAFPYGRAALAAFLQAVGLKDAEVIAPSYTCVVVQHATVLSGNVPRFVDNTLTDYNMDLDQVAAAISERTGAIVATHLFGFPLDLDRLHAIVRDAEQRFGRKIWVIQDCAHSFGARWQGRLVCREGDTALFGLNISKVLSSIFGGMLTFNDAALAATVRAWRDAHLTPAGGLKPALRLAYLAATYPAFHSLPYGFVHWLQYKTSVLDRLTKAYHLDEAIRFPPDAGERMLPIEARVGRVQLAKYDALVAARRANAAHYTEALQGIPGWVLPPLVEGATWSHYPVRVPDRDAAVRHFAGHGVHVGEVVEYSVAHLPSYAQWAAGQELPNALLCSRHMINLPVHPQLTEAERARVVAAARGRA